MTNVHELEKEVKRLKKIISEYWDSLQANITEKEYWRKRIAELEAQLANLRDHRPMTNACNICWTSSWAPCEEGAEEAIQLNGDWVICQMCQAERWLVDVRARLATAQAACREFTEYVEFEERNKGFAVFGIKGKTYRMAKAALDA